MQNFPRVLATILLASVILASPVRPAVAQTQPTPIPSPTAVEPTQDDAKPPPWDVAGRAGDAINSWIRGLVVSALEPVIGFLGKSILATPELDGNARVRELWRFSLGIANAALVLFVLVGGGIVSVGGLSSQLTVKELLPRVLVAGIAVNLGLLLAGQLIDVGNALTFALLGAATDSSDASSQIAEGIYGAGMQSALFLVLALPVVVLAVFVLVTYVIRVAVLVVLLAGGPLFLMTHSLPQTDHVARTWWRLLIAMIVSPIIQALVLTAAVKVFLSGDGVLGLTSGALIDLLIIGCLLYLLYRIPLWTIDVALRGGGSRAWSTAKQKAVVAVKSAVAP